MAQSVWSVMYMTSASGMNSIVVYVGHDLLWRLFPINWEIEHIHWKLLLQDVWGAGIWCFIAYLMFRKKFFVAI